VSDEKPPGPDHAAPRRRRKKKPAPPAPKASVPVELQDTSEPEPVPESVEIDPDDELLAAVRKRRGETPKAPRPKIEWRRFSPLLLVAILVVVGLALDSRVDDPPPAGADRPEAEGLLEPVAAPASALRSTWYCAGGTATTDGAAAHKVVVLNASDTDRTGTVTVYPGQVHPLTDDSIDLPEPVEVPLDVPAHSQTEVRLGEYITAPYASALVEVDGGEVSVEHEVIGPAGRDSSPCSSAASNVWHFADGTTVQGAQETLAIFNPFPDDAVVDIAFATDDGRREPEDYDGLVIPSGEVVAADVTATVTVREHVSSTVTARTGRVIVDRIQSFDGSTGAEGLTVTLGAAEPALSWAWADGLVGGGVSERYSVYNPTDDRAEVSLEIRPDDEAIVIEPFELTIPPRSFGIVDSDQLRGRLGESAVPHGAVLRSLNNVPVVAERRNGGSPESERPGVDLTLGVPRLSDRVIIATPSQGPSIDDTITVFNPTEGELSFTVSPLDGGDPDPIGGEITVEAFSRATFVLSDNGIQGVPVLVELLFPAVVERSTSYPADGDTSSAAAVALSGTLSPIPAG
jgi:hypothetical protein